MKSKRSLLIMATLPVLAAGIAIGVANANTFNFARTEAATRVDSTIEIEEDARVGGNAFYFAVSANWHDDWQYDNNWESGGAKFALYFWDTETGEDAWTGFILPGTDHIGTDGTNSRIFETVVPTKAGVTQWTNAKAVRFNPAAETPAWDGNVYNQGKDEDLSKTNNRIQVGAWSGSAIYSTPASDRIAYWANAASQWTSSGVCDNDGATDTEDLTTSWNATKDTYNAIKGADVKDYFKHTNGEKGSSTKALDIMARYDWIYQRYHTALSLEDFAHRFVVE